MTSKQLLLEVNNNAPALVNCASDTLAKLSLEERIVSPVKIITVDTCDGDSNTERGRDATSRKSSSHEKCSSNDGDTRRQVRKAPHRRLETEGRSGKRVRDRLRGGRGKGKTEQVDQSSHKDVPMKNAVMMLNEMFPPPTAPQYRVTSMTGTPNNPTFSMTCILLDQTFSGTGRSKKEAKLDASQKALQEMFGKDFSEGGGTEGSGNTSNPRSLSEIDSWLELEGKNPVSILNELYPGVIFQLVSAEGPSHAPQFCVRATLASLSYEGRGISKKEAKLHASKALLVHIHRVGFDPMTGNMKSGGEGQPDTVRADGHSWADKVGGLVREQFNRLFDGTTYSKRKVMAGVVLDHAGITTVICLSSGTKCVNGEQLCLGGSSLNDCHAEVIARRCLVAWLYNQLELAILGRTSVLQRDQEGGFRLLQGVSFHLFISTAPCGDARIFSLHEQPASGTNCLTGYAGRPGEGNRGKLRSKIESGMGTVPLPEEKKLQTWDGVMSGERLLTMACSDKILMWNVVGVQGSLLSHWLRPIYFSTITVGSRFHPEHVRRALHGRVGGVHHPVLELPNNFRLNEPPLLATTSPEARQATKAQEYSLNWVAGCTPEIVLGSTGKTTAGPPSRLSKQSLATSFAVMCRLPGAMTMARPSLVMLEMEKVSNCRYSDLKQMARDYMEAKNRLVEKLVERGAGRWVEKPVEQDQFYIEQ
eukprot:GFUD01024706.1.p1 GENE.GFUD01024706.1~~GFUD01024706.1.p1  ORF type:complete len:703 (+),score=193.42 GFUD01024706.1:51-2159(+)